MTKLPDWKKRKCIEEVKAAIAGAKKSKKKVNREVIYEKFAARYKVSESSIEKWILAGQRKEDEYSLSLAVYSDRKFGEHEKQLGVMKINLKDRIQDILNGKYDASRNISEGGSSVLRMQGNIVDGFELSSPLHLQSPLNSEGLHKATAEYVRQHYQAANGELPFGQWEDLRPEHAIQDIADKLGEMEIEFCRSCDRCQEIKGMVKKRMASA